MRFRATPFRLAQTRRPWWLTPAFVAAYVATAVIAYKWTVVPGGLAIFWLNNGLVAAALLLLSPMRALAVAVAGLATDVLCARFLGGSTWTQAGLIGGFDLGEAWLAGVLIRNFGGAALDLTRVRRFATVGFCGMLPAALIAGTAGALTFATLYGDPFPSLWVRWAVGDILGMAIGAPAALIILRFRRFDRPALSSPWVSVSLLLGLCALTVIPLWIAAPPLAFTIFPLFLIAAFRLTPPYGAVAVVLFAIIAAGLTISGHGPFAAARVGEDVGILRLQLLLACVVISLFLVQGSLAERARTQTRVEGAMSRISIARARAEAALEELAASEMRFRMLADNASDMISRSRLDGVLTYVSPSVRDVLGYAPEELIGTSAAHFIHPDDAGELRLRMSALIHAGASGPQERVEYRAVTRSGDIRWIEASLHILRNPETGALIELQDISRDVTGRKTLEAELEARRMEAEAASVAKSQFLANMSHEIRTPLNGVIATADLLARSDLNAHERKLVEIIRSSGDSLNRLLSDVLDLARIEAGRVELEMAPFHLGDTVRSAVELCSLRAQEKGLLVLVEAASEADRHFEGDAVRIRQIVTNLVSNAVKFTAQGEVRVRIEAPLSGGVRIEVADTGVGFDPALRERLFDRFQQADGSITRQFGGTGLGLPISRQLAEAMGGSLHCDSAPGEGSRFWFEAPLTPAQPIEASDDGADELQTAAGGKILVVDDHPTNRTVAELILTDFGFDVETAADGVEAVAAFEGGSFDLILMDMQMPVLDGLAAVRRIRTLEAARGLPRLPILMLTANALPAHAAQSEAAGADGHVAKPITAAALMKAIVALTETAAAQDPESDLGARAAV